MSLGRTVVAVSVDHGRLFALVGTVGSSAVSVKTCLSAGIPGNVESDPDKFGKWLGEQLRKAGVGRARLVFAVTRGEVVLKRLRLPRPAGGDVELAGMVRLQMAKQLTLALDGTAIDYCVLGDLPGEASSNQVSVLAGALPGDRTTWYRKAARAAGFKLERIGLFASGATAILSPVSQRHSGPVLGIAAGPTSMEFVVVQEGRLVFARSAEVGDVMTSEAKEEEDGAESPAAAQAGLTQRAAVEAKRTWMSYRVGQDSAEIDAVVVVGEGELARQIGRQCGEALEMQWRLAVVPESINLPKDMPEEQRLTAAALAGLLGERFLARPTLDFAHPRKVPDLAARKRQRILAAAMVLLGVGVGGYAFATMELADLQAERDRLRGEGADLRRAEQEFMREQARLGHIQAWTSAGVDWVAHAGWISEQLPDPRQARLGKLTGDLTVQVQYTARGGRYDPAAWKVEQAAGLGIAGEIPRGGREVMNQLRETLVKSPVYERVDTVGPDVPERFALRLWSTHASPADALKEAKPEGEPRARGGGR